MAAFFKGSFLKLYKYIVPKSDLIFLPFFNTTAISSLSVKTEQLSGLDIFIANRNFLSTFSPSSGKNCTAVFRTHSFPETMLILSFSVAGLKSSFHYFSIFKSQKSNLINKISFKQKR